MTPEPPLKRYYVRFAGTTCYLYVDPFDRTLSWVTAKKRRDCTGFASEAAARQAYQESKAGHGRYCEVLVR